MELSEQKKRKKKGKFTKISKKILKKMVDSKYEKGSEMSHFGSVFGRFLLISTVFGTKSDVFRVFCHINDVQLCFPKGVRGVVRCPLFDTFTPPHLSFWCHIWYISIYI